MNKEDNKVEDEIVEEQEVVENADETTEEVAEEVTAEDETSKLQNDYNKLKDDYIRLYAEMDNMKKRSQLETEKTIKFAISSFAKELLGVADNLERAITAMEM